MRIIFIVMLVLHGLIHLFGFFKSLAPDKLPQLTMPISRTGGVLWLVTALLMLFTASMYALKSEYAWLYASGALILSQILVLNSWQDAKFGTAANVVVLLVAIVGFAEFQFMREGSSRVTLLLQAKQPQLVDAGRRDRFKALPSPVRQWITASGLQYDSEISHVKLQQNLGMRTDRNQKEWSAARAVQTVTVNPPGFVWQAQMQMAGPLTVWIRDSFIEGQAGMLVKPLGLFAAVDQKQSAKLDQGALQRYLAEMVWYPQAALSPLIVWESIDHNTARATIEYNGVVGSGFFHFTPDALVHEFTAMRYRELEPDSEPVPWIIQMQNHQKMQGVMVPTEATVIWGTIDGDWTWLKVQVSDLTYE